MRLDELVPNKATLLDKAFAHPVMKIKPRAANPYPSMDDALKATINAIEYSVIETVAEEIKPALEDVLLNRTIMDGDYDDAEDKDAWESATDDLVEAAIEKYVPICSQDWLGNHTIGCGLHLKDGVQKFATSLGREVYKQLTYALEKSPAKIMSAAGVVQKDVEARLTLHNQTKEKPMSDDTESLDAVIAKIAEYVGKDYDILTVYDDLDFASDDDDNLAFGAAARLGIEPEEIEVLRDVRLMQGDDTAQHLSDLLEAAAKGTGKKKAAAKPKAEKPAAAPKAPAKPKAAAKPAKGEATGAVSADTLQKMKEACVFKDADVAQRLGVSRATFNNWVNGKTAADLNANQTTELRDEIVTRANLLLEALAELDGTEAQMVF